MAVLSRVRRKWEEKENKEKKGKRKKKEFVKRMRRPKNVAAAEGKIWEIWSLLVSVCPLPVGLPILCVCHCAWHLTYVPYI